MLFKALYTCASLDGADTKTFGAKVPIQNTKLEKIDIAKRGFLDMSKSSSLKGLVG